MIENASGRHYVGITTDVDRRLKEHNKGSAKSTRPFGPWKLIHTEEFLNRSEALKREYYLKHEKGKKEKQSIISSCHCEEVRRSNLDAENYSREGFLKT